jgi:hypothetical protein
MLDRASFGNTRTSERRSPASSSSVPSACRCRVHASPHLHAAADDEHGVAAVRRETRCAFHAVRATERRSDPHPALRAHHVSRRRSSHLGVGSFDVLHRTARWRDVSRCANPGCEDGCGDDTFSVLGRHSAKNYPAEEGNSGLFWRTKFNGKRVGHGGNDQG